MMFLESEVNKIEIAKTIITKQIHTLLDELPKVLSDYLYDNAILTGGAIASIMLQETPKDYDLYLSDANHILWFKQYVMSMDQNLIQDANEKYVDVQMAGKLVTANATTFKNNLQVITMNTAIVRSTFDFVHCMPWYSLSNNTLHISIKQYHAIMNKKLIKNENFINSLSIKRIEKYVSRGWKLQ